LLGQRPAGYGQLPIGSLAAADLLAANDLLARWPHWMTRREDVQRRRKRNDADIFRLFLRPLWCMEDNPGYQELFDGAGRYFGVTDLFEGLTVGPNDKTK
jgi:hypothetical protein